MTVSKTITPLAGSAGWFVVWTHSRAEKQVASRIAAMGMEQWLPTVTERHQWSDRWKDVVLPLFPGYVFARGTAGELHRLLRTPGVMTIVKNGTRAAFLSDGFVSSLRRAINTPELEPTAVSERCYGVEDEVVIREGPLAGLRGVVKEIRNGRRLVVWVGEIGRGVAFTLVPTAVSG